MKKLLYSSLLLVGLVACYQMDARHKSGDEALAKADVESLVAKISDLENKLASRNYDYSRSYTLKDKATDILDAVAPERNKHETIELLKRAKKALKSAQHSENKLKVVANKVDQMEKLS